MGQVTIKDIARELKISPSTVSRALKDHPDISPETKKAVNELASQLKYQPNTIALSLRKSRSFTIGVIIPEIAHYFFANVISGIEDVASQKGYSVIICQSGESFDREVRNTNALISHRVDGLLVSPSKETSNFDHLQEIFDEGKPLVFFDRVTEEIASSRVIVDDFEGAFNATEHLIQMGCQRIAHIAGPKGLLITKNRINGYKAALEKHGLPVREDLIETCQEHKIEAGRNVGKKLLSLAARPDGIFANNDINAIGAMVAIKEKGLNIPYDIAVVGFSDWQMSSWTEPSLSSVAQPGFEMGQIATQILLDQIENKEHFQPETQILKTKLIIRDSSRRK